MQIHFIAIGGSAMHNLAIALHKQGHKISGSDDEIFEPSKSRLKKYGLLPAEMGWKDTHIHKDLDAIILGMHAKSDNPELKKARELQLPIYSFPSYLYEHAKGKKRIVIGGSHGKTTITAMILHALHQRNIKADYMIGAQLEGFEIMVSLSNDTNIMIFEGDEYLTSVRDPHPKFHVYQPHIALLSGIAWDHFNVFPTFENYKEQFRKFIDLLPPDGSLVYYSGDETLQQLINDYRGKAGLIPYQIATHEIKNGQTVVKYEGKEYPVKVFGEHNLKNLQGAMLICREIGMEPHNFLQTMKSFSGASNRLEKIDENTHTKIFKDFAHSPSKVEATTRAVKNQFPERQLIAVLELHTYSSLNKDFLPLYCGTLDHVDKPVIFYNEHALKLKRLPMLNENDIFQAFGNKKIQIFHDKKALEDFLLQFHWKNKNLLLMSSGNFDGMDEIKLATKILK